jgi:Universal stress protein family
MTISASKCEVREGTSLPSEVTSVHISGILAATDFSNQAILTLKMAAQLAKRFHSRLHVLYVSPPQPYAPGAGVLVPTLQQVNMALARNSFTNTLSRFLRFEPSLRFTSSYPVLPECFRGRRFASVTYITALSLPLS